MRHPHSVHRQPDLFSPKDPPVPIAAFDRAKLLPLVSALLEPRRDFRRLRSLRGWSDGEAEIIGSVCA